MGIIDRAKEKATELKDQAAQKATELKDQAAQKATELKDQAAQKATELKDQAAQKASALKEQASQKAAELKDEAAHAASELMEGALNKVRETLADFNSALPIVGSAGWTLIDVKITLGLPPKVIGKFAAKQPLSDEQLEQLCVEHADKRLAVLLVRTLHRAQRLQDSVHIGALKPKGIAIGIGLIPSVEVEFA